MNLRVQTQRKAILLIALLVQTLQLVNNSRGVGKSLVKALNTVRLVHYLRMTT